MLSNAYVVAKFRFDTAENEPAKNFAKFSKNAFFENAFSKNRPVVSEVTIPLKHYVNVYRNEQLANFLHNRTTRLLFALSGVGLLFFPSRERY